MASEVSTGPVAEFCAKLRQLQQASGLDRAALVRQLNRGDNKISKSQLYAILNGEIKRPPDWDTLVEPLVQVCTRGDKSTIAQWRRHHDVLIAVHEELNRLSRQTSQPERLVPRQLPAAVSYFAGRDRERAALTGLLRDRADKGGTVVISAIAGTAGVGKTALAVYWAHQVADRFPDGQLYVNLRGFHPSGAVMQPGDAVRRFLDALDVPAQRIPTDLDAQAALYRSQLAGRRMLVVLDNARDTTQIRPLLPGTPTCLVLVTSRNQLTSLIATDGAHPITLDLLTPEDAQQLLARRLGTARVAAESQAVADIVTRCAHLPLALALVAAHAAIRPHVALRILADELRDTQRRWEMLTGDDPTMDVRVVFSWSYQALTPEAARLFRLLGLHPGPDLSAPAAVSLAGSPATTVRPLLAELTRASLLIEHTPDRYTFHDLLRAYAAEQADITDSDQQRHAAKHRLLDHYLHTAHTAALLVEPHRTPITLIPPQPGTIPERPGDHGQALAWFTTEHPILLTAIDQAADIGFDTHAWQLAWTLANFLDRRGHWHDAAATGAAAVAATRRLADPSAQARAHQLLAHAYKRLVRYDDAYTHLRRSLDLRQPGDLSGQAHTHVGLAQVREWQGLHTEALDHACQALVLFQTASDRIGQANALNNIGWLHAQLGDYHQAITSCQQALSLVDELGDQEGQASAWDSLGYAHHHLGHHDEAITCYQHALDLFRDLGSRYYEADTLTHIGDAYHAAGDSQGARNGWQQALIILDDLDHPDADQVRTKLSTLDTQDHSPATPSGVVNR